MNEIELYQCLSEHPVTKNTFRGVFARDELTNETFKQNTMFVVNTDMRNKPGQHWVLCHWNGIIPLFFDSYGLSAHVYGNIEDFLLQNSHVYQYNMRRLQADNSNVCGHYVAYVASQLCLGHTLEDIREKHFSIKNLALNDANIVTLFRKEFGYPITHYKNVMYTPMICQCQINGN